MCNRLKFAKIAQDATFYDWAMYIVFFFLLSSYILVAHIKF